jgi:REP-associated tyrosine transposase
MARPQRLSTFDYLGPRRYFLTCCVQDRRSVFVDDDTVSLVRSHFLEQASVCAFAILVYCFMPDHLYLLVEATADHSELRRFVARAKQHAAFDFSRRYGHRLWQEGYYDHVLRNDESTSAFIRYTVANPVRAGLVDDPMDYPYWGSGIWPREALLDFLAIERRP